MSTQCLYQCPCVSCYLRLRQPMLFIQNGAFCNLFDYAHASAYAHVSACPHAHAHTHVSFPNVSAYAHDLSPSPLANLFVESFANCYSLATIQNEWLLILSPINIPMLASSCPYWVQGAPFGFYKPPPIEFKALLLDSLPPHRGHHVLDDLKVPSVIVNHCKTKFANSPMSKWLQSVNYRTAIQVY